MSDQHDDDTQRRLDHLEARVRQLEARLAAQDADAAPRGPVERCSEAEPEAGIGRGGPSMAPAEDGSLGADRTQAIPAASSRLERPEDAASDQPADGSRADSSFQIENWLDKIGLALVLLGLGFLYKLSVELGLLTPLVKVGLGVALGAGLSIAGWRVRASRLRLGQLLLGGGGAAFYITIFAAYQLYEFIAHPVAFAAMSAVTMATFILSVYERDAVLAVVGAIGGFATPFVLSTGSGDYVGLSLYNLLLVAGVTAIYVACGWKRLLFVQTVGGWFVAGMALVLLDQAADPALLDRLVVQLGVVAAWLGVGVAPLVRARLHERPPGIEQGGSVRLWLVLLAVSGSAVAGVALTRQIWEAPDAAWVVVYLGLLAVYAWGSQRLVDRATTRWYASLLRIVAAGLAALAGVEAFDGEGVLVALAIVGLAIYLVAHRLGDRPLSVVGYLLQAVVLLGASLWLALDDTRAATAFLNVRSLQLLAVGAALLASTFAMPHRAMRRLTRYALHAFALGYLLDQALLWSDVAATATWAAYALGLVVAGIGFERRRLQVLGLLTVVLTAGKLLIVDMADTETIWRVALFLGFGAALLAVSYLTPLLGRRGGSSTGER